MIRYFICRGHTCSGSRQTTRTLWLESCPITRGISPHRHCNPAWLWVGYSGSPPCQNLYLILQSHSNGPDVFHQHYEHQVLLLARVFLRWNPAWDDWDSGEQHCIHYHRETEGYQKVSRQFYFFQQRLFLTFEYLSGFSNCNSIQQLIEILIAVGIVFELRRPTVQFPAAAGIFLGCGDPWSNF